MIFNQDGGCPHHRNPPLINGAHNTLAGGEDNTDDSSG